MLPAAAAAAVVLLTLVPAAYSNRDCSKNAVDACLQTSETCFSLATLAIGKHYAWLFALKQCVLKLTTTKAVSMPSAAADDTQTHNAHLCCCSSPAAQSRLDLQVVALQVHSQALTVQGELPSPLTLGLVVAVAVAMAVQMVKNPVMLVAQLVVLVMGRLLKVLQDLQGWVMVIVMVMETQGPSLSG
jgi:hypothetical protein